MALNKVMHDYWPTDPDRLYGAEVSVGEEWPGFNPDPVLWAIEALGFDVIDPTVGQVRWYWTQRNRPNGRWLGTAVEVNTGTGPVVFHHEVGSNEWGHPLELPWVAVIPTGDHVLRIPQGNDTAERLVERAIDARQHVAQPDYWWSAFPPEGLREPRR